MNRSLVTSLACLILAGGCSTSSSTRSSRLVKDDRWWETPFATASAAFNRIEKVSPDFTVAAKELRVVRRNQAGESVAVTAKGGVLVQSTMEGQLVGRADRLSIENGVLELRGNPDVVRGQSRLISIEPSGVIVVNGTRLTVIGLSRTELLPARKIAQEAARPAPSTVRKSNTPSNPKPNVSSRTATPTTSRGGGLVPLPEMRLPQEEPLLNGPFSGR